MADAELADQVQAAYESGSINERCAYQAWCLIAVATRLGISVMLELPPRSRSS